MRWLICGAFLAVNAFAQTDPTDPLGGSRWSPNSEWVALNWPERPELFVISLKTGLSFTLRPAGDLQLDTAQPFATRAEPGGVDRRHTTRIIPSPGRGTFTLLEWSPDSQQVVYQAGTQTNAIFSVLEESVTRRMASSEILPWHKPDELRVTLELINAASGHPAAYRMRIQKFDGTVVREVVFDDPREVHCLAAVRSREASFLTPDRRFVLYPRVGSNGWQLVREPLTIVDQIPVTKPSPIEPYQWQLSHNHQLLALVEGDTLSLGALYYWDYARAFSLPHESMLVRWSPDDKYLALSDGHSLHVKSFAQDQPKLVTENCASRFWGWRGSRLYFGDSHTDLTDLSYVDAEHLAAPTRVSTPKREWESATREVSLSPDGERLVCLVPQTNYEARPVWQLWQRVLTENAGWQLMYELKPQ